MNITVVGGGNIGTQFAVHCAEKGHRVIMYSSKSHLFQKELSIVNSEGKVTHVGVIQEATYDAEKAFSDADLIFVTMPAYCMSKIAALVYPYVSKGTRICLVPGIGGGECSFKSCVEKGCIVMGMQRVPSVARLVTYGEKVCASGYRDKLFVSAIPKSETDKCAQIIEDIFDMPCETLANYLNVTLTPSNPILHTTRLCTLFEDYESGVIYEKIPLFYEEWSDKSSELLLKCDAELQALCMELKEFDLTGVRSLKEHYESNTAEELTQKMKSIESLKGLQTPSIEVNGGVIPDFTSRYFTADFPFGLALIYDIAKMVSFKVPNIERTLEWYNKRANGDKNFTYADYGISSYKEFVEYYKQ